MEPDLSGTSLGDYGSTVYAKYHCTCVYCGFDGRHFEGWMQLSLDHVLPLASGGKDDDSNTVVCCRACNSITSRMKFDKNATFEEIVQQKRERVAKRIREFYRFWSDHVAPLYLDRPLAAFRRM